MASRLVQLPWARCKQVQKRNTKKSIDHQEAQATTACQTCSEGKKEEEGRKNTP